MKYKGTCMDLSVDKIPVKVKKVKASYSIDEDVLNEFNRVCKDKRINKSLLITGLLKSFVNSMKTK